MAEEAKTKKISSLSDTKKKGVIISTPKKNVSFSTPTMVVYSKGCLPRNHYLEPVEKQMHLYESPDNKAESVINENVVFDEFEETITEESKEYIDIATDKIVIEPGCYIFSLFFQLVKTGKYSLSNIAMLLWLETMRWFSLEIYSFIYL